jgi:hypothetical protein
MHAKVLSARETKGTLAWGVSEEACDRKDGSRRGA